MTIPDKRLNQYLNKYKLLGIVIPLLAIGAYVLWQFNKPAGRPAFPPSVVTAVEVKQQDWLPTLNSVGSLVAVNGINLSTEVNGIVSEIVFTSGQPVDKGEILLKLDDSVDLAGLDALRADQRLAQVQYNRAKDLYKKRVTSKSNLDEAQARLDMTKARVKQQQEIINHKIIRAPFAGLAGIRQVDIGQFIKEGDAIVSLQTLDPIYVDYNLPERHAIKIKPGHNVSLELDAIPGKTFTGRVTAVNSGIDTGTRSLKVRAQLDNKDKLLRPGMFAEVQTVVGEAQKVLTLPRTAISFNSYGNYVFVVNKTDKGMFVKNTPVQTGESREGDIKVKNLKQGTLVIRAGMVKLRDNAPVVLNDSIKLDDKKLQGE